MIYLCDCKVALNLIKRIYLLFLFSNASELKFEYHAKMLLKLSIQINY